MPPTKEHWDSVYAANEVNNLSWTQPEPTTSLSLITQACPAGSVIDVGGGTSCLAERLLSRGYAVTLLDVSETALLRARSKVGILEAQIHWVVADVTDLPDLGTFDVWHDRAVFHFLLTPDERAAYVASLTASLRPGGHAVIATFALDGPSRCSGLEVRRYNGDSLTLELGPKFTLRKSVEEVHTTPRDRQQAFQYSLFRRI